MEDSSSDSRACLSEPEVTGLFKHIGKAIPYFRKPQNVLVFKLDVLLLTWMFVAGYVSPTYLDPLHLHAPANQSSLLKEMDQSATTQAYVSGMREALSLYGNELVEFNTFFSIGYAIGLIPGQLIQTKVRPSLFLPCCEIIWGFLVLL